MYKELIERLRFQTRYTYGQVPVTMIEAADALERLTQPVDVVPVSISLDRGYLYSAEIVARLQQERDILQDQKDNFQTVAQATHDVFTENIDTLQDQVKLLRDAIGKCKFDSLNMTIADMQAIGEALAATEPKGE